LIAFFNHLFEKLFQLPADMPPELRKTLDELGYVQHEDSEPKRELRDEGALVELMVTAKVPIEDDPRAEQDTRVLDAKQVARRIDALKSQSPDLKYGDIALLFRAMTHVQIYEAAFRHANIPYQTVLGRGFYEREEITDLIQLLRFLDNKTDELALAAVLRSPLCGLSDNALLALRTPPARRLYTALQSHREIENITDEEHDLLDRADRLISRLVARRHHYSIHDLLRLAVQESEYMTVVAANFDGAQRLANIQRLFTLAARFESSGTHLIRDFVRYVEEFEAIGSRESEGQIDQAADAVRLMTIHQAKGLEFPVVIIPDLQRLSRVATDNWVLLDRHQGLTMKVPDGRGSLVAGCTFSHFEKRHAYRELFESRRLLYVAATRAEDRLILSGATDELPALSRATDSWLKWIWQALELEGRTQTDVIDLPDGVQLQLTINLADEPLPEVEPETEEVLETGPAGESLGQVFPLRRPLIATAGSSIHRFSVTQLINYQRCPRQYYFERVLRLPQADELAIWNNADAPEPPSNINASLKGAVIHRFCERYTPDQDSEALLRQSFAEVLRLRQAQLADRLVEINPEAAIKDLLPLAENYLASDVFKRVERAREEVRSGSSLPTAPLTGEAGLWSELSFRLRRPLGILSGIIDKLLITQSAEGWLEAEIVDFKTNRIRVDVPAIVYEAPAKKRRSRSPQFAFDFEDETEPPRLDVATNNMIEITARDYQLQMQAYAHAVRELIPSLATARIRVTLHFLDPNVETHLSDELLEPARCARAIDEAMMRIVTSADPRHFPVKTAPHCRMCNFLRVCTAGKEYLR
jgi:ATP-dependent helicase/nuclease subunit A